VLANKYRPPAIHQSVRRTSHMLERGTNLWDPTRIVLYPVMIASSSESGWMWRWSLVVVKAFECSTVCIPIDQSLVSPDQNLSSLHSWPGLTTGDWTCWDRMVFADGSLVEDRCEVHQGLLPAECQSCLHRDYRLERALASEIWRHHSWFLTTPRPRLAARSACSC